MLIMDFGYSDTTIETIGDFGSTSSIMDYSRNGNR